ncbi:NAD-dependent dehydratase [Labrys miyagiensis]|uniref:NAD-dependent dehydratase n=1 Tax=Labrys miyagiensis TaxID=346912 RepID=A0ABQ6CWQ1_9HYPH|nr:SDR family oxidoreductase [Labrys miyagiensis]GLS22707.1 NAD-dependent dehydratase [Labrys miyagiensis]
MLHHLHSVPVRPERVVVIGAGGFVGGAVKQAAEAAGIEVLGLARSDVDLSAPDAGRKLAGSLRAGDAVVAATAKAPCRNLDMLIENLAITRAMIAALDAVPVAHVINISSDAVYGDEPVPLTENAPTAPGSYHGAMHLAREIAFRSEIKAPLAILRPTLVYGASDPHNGYGPNRFRRLANAGEDIVLFGAGEERRDHVLIEDVAEIVLRVLMYRSTGTLNVATGEVHSFRTIADLAIAAASSASVIKETPRSGPMPHNGYRPFDIAGTRAAFPGFEYVKLPAGIRHVQEQTVGHG